MPQQQARPRKDWIFGVVWTLRILLVLAAIGLGIWAQASMPPTVKLGPMGASRWKAAAGGFQLYGWACVVFVLACLPGKQDFKLNPSQLVKIPGTVLVLSSLVLIGIGLWGLYRFELFLWGFAWLFGGFALLSVAYSLLNLNSPGLRLPPLPVTREKSKDQEGKDKKEDPLALEDVETSRSNKMPLWRKLLPWGLLLLSVLLTVFAFLLWTWKLERAWPYIPLLMGIIAGGVGLGWLDHRRGIPPFRRIELPKLWEVGFLLAILLLAIFFRFYQLETVPEGIWFDEAESALEARTILSGAPFSPMNHFTNNPSFPFHILAFFMKIFGDTLWTLRLVVALMGLVGVIGMYLLGREMFGRWSGIIAATLLAVGFWHVNFSRFFMQNIFAPGLAIWCFYFLFRGLRNRRKLDFMFAGICIGLGLQSYTGFRVVPPVIPVLFVLAVFFQRKFLFRYFFPFCVLVYFSFVSVGPLGVFAATQWEKFTDRMEETSVFRSSGGRTEEQIWRDFEKNFIEHSLMFHFWGDRNPRHGLSAEPKVDFATGILMMLGLALAFYHWRDPRYFLLPVWLAIGLLGGILSLEFESPQTARTVAVIPVPFFLAAVALDQVRQLFRLTLPRATPWIFGILVIPLLGWIAWENYDIYFNQQMKRGDTWSEFSGRDTEVARLMMQLEPKDICYNQNAGTRQSSYLLPEKKYQDRFFKYHKDFPPSEPIPADHRVVYCLESWRENLPEKLWKHYFPEGKFDNVVKYGIPVFYTFIIEGKDIRKARGIQVIPLEEENPTGNSFTRPAFVIETGQWKSLSGNEFPARLRAEGILYIPHTSRYRFSVEGGFQGEVYINNEPVLSQSEGASLIKGWNSVRVEGRWDGTAALRLLWSSANNPVFAPIPEHYLYHKSLPDFGLLGLYYNNSNWQGQPAYRQIDPTASFRWHPDPFTRHWSGEWRGKIEAPQDGNYLFMLNSNDRSKLWIDNRLIMEQNRQTSGRRTSGVRLNGGLHDIQLRYIQGTAYSEMRLRWQRPGAGMDFIQPEYLTPADR
jgi:4-amino-4-deoxy-L-arabinose transferase-like glycosyltransferase